MLETKFCPICHLGMYLVANLSGEIIPNLYVCKNCHKLHETHFDTKAFIY